MKKTKKDTALEKASGNQIAQMAYDAAMWYKAVFLQAIRFVSVNCETPFLLPWCEHKEMPEGAERFFLIVSIDHALTNIKDLNLTLLHRNDFRLKELKEDLLDKDNFYEKIRRLRNANEHNTEYRLGIGNGQDLFCSTVSTKYGKFTTNSHWFFQVGDEAFLGGINFKEMLKHMEVNRDKIIPLLEKIFWDYFGS